jgi:hypothetical protein
LAIGACNAVIRAGEDAGAPRFSFALFHDNHANLHHSNKNGMGRFARDPRQILIISMSIKTMLTKLLEKIKNANRRLIVALAGYLVLIIIILYSFLPVQTRDDQFFLALVLGLFAILIIRTIAHSKNDD